MATATIAANAGSAGGARAAGRPTSLTPAGAQAVFRATLDVLARPGTVKRLPSAGNEPLAGYVPSALLPLLALADLSTPACVVDTPPGSAGAVDGQQVDGQAIDGYLGSNGGREAGDKAAPDAGRTAWDEIVRVATNAPRAALADARLVAALRPLAPAEFASLRIGTAAAPEDGALACLAVAGIAIVDGANAELEAWAGDAREKDARASSGRSRGDSGRLLLRLSGPGVPGTRAIIVTGLPAGFAAARRGLVAGFPAGADLLLIAPDGAVTGLPRTTSVEERAI